MKTDFDFYLSEMSVSNLHGGGLTLQRVLREDLKQIKYFFHCGRFGKDLPPAEEFKDRSIDLIQFWNSDNVRDIIGRSASAALSKNSALVKFQSLESAKYIDKKIGLKEVLFGLVCPQGVQSIYALEQLKRRRKVSYVSWVMDDHLVKYHDDRWHYPRNIESLFSKHLNEAAAVFVISPAMQSFYKERFGIDAHVLFGSADLKPAVTKPAGAVLKLGYFGAVTSWQIDALTLIAKVLPEIGAELHIYSGVNTLPKDLNVDGVYLMGKLQPIEVLPAMQKYNAVLLPISFSNQLRGMSEFNIATKMSECLASGVPVIAIGPQYAAMIAYLKDRQAAISIDSENAADVVNAIKQLHDRQKITEMLENARKLVIDEIGVQPMHQKWLNVVDKLSHSNGVAL